MGLHMVSGPLVGGGLGWLVDSWIDSWPWGSGIGLLLGIMAGFRNVWIDARYLIRSDARLDREDKLSRRQPQRQSVPDPGHGDPPREADAAEEAAAPDMRSASVVAGTVTESVEEDSLDEMEEEILRILGPDALKKAEPERDREQR